MTRVGAIDIGTNSTRLLIADIEHGELAEVERRSVVTRLGEGVDASRILRPEAIDRVMAVLDEFAVALGSTGVERTLAVATSAARDASNGQAFLDEVGRRLGAATRLLSGDEEARLTRRGVGAAAPATLVLDVGGGSTELILGEVRLSLDVGSVRVTERFLHSDPPTETELATAAAFVRGLLPALTVEAAIGVAGTVTQLHDLVGELSREAVEAELAHLASLPLAERARLPRMDPARAPVIVGGTVIVREVLVHYDLPLLAWSRRDLLDGVAFDAAALAAPG